LVRGGGSGVNVEDGEVKRGAAALGEVELDVFVEEVQEDGRGDAEGET
jgi:hypothetical protein